MSPKSAGKGAGKQKAKAPPKGKVKKVAPASARKPVMKSVKPVAKKGPKPAAKAVPARSLFNKGRPAAPAKPLAKSSAKPLVKVAAPKGAPAPIGKFGRKGKAGAKGGSGHGAEGGHDQVGLEFEMVEAPIPVVVHEPPIPTPSRRKPKPGSPDWPGEGLTVGMEAPAFSLPSTLGRKVTLAEFRGTRVVLYFYPKDDTPGCTMEACAFRDNMSRITSKDAVVLGISLDDELSHQRFAQKYNLQFPLLSDVDASICRRYGTYKEKSLYGRSFWGVERTTFVIDREGKVENVFRRVKVEGHADEVLATLSV